MSRSKWWLATPAAAALLAVGCAHCDTCDDFPRSSSSRYAQGSYTPWAGSELAAVDSTTAATQMHVPMVAAPAPMVSAPATASPGPFTGSDAAPTPPEGRTTLTPAQEKVSPPAIPAEANLELPEMPAEPKPNLPAEPPLSPPPANPADSPIETPPALD